MANYQPEKRPFPNLHNIQNDFSNQTESDRFSKETLNLCEKANITISKLIEFTLITLNEPTRTGIEDQQVFADVLIKRYQNLPDDTESVSLYRGIKGIPAHSIGRIGYTFGRGKGKWGKEKGLFLFIR